MTDELFIKNEYARTTERTNEVMGADDHHVGLRSYRSSPGRLTMQVRTYGATTQTRGGKKRAMYSSVEISVAEATRLRAHLEAFIAEGK